MSGRPARRRPPVAGRLISGKKFFQRESRPVRPRRTVGGLASCSGTWPIVFRCPPQRPEPSARLHAGRRALHACIASSPPGIWQWCRAAERTSGTAMYIRDPGRNPNLPPAAARSRLISGLATNTRMPPRFRCGGDPPAPGTAMRKYSCWHGSTPRPSGRWPICWWNAAPSRLRRWKGLFPQLHERVGDRGCMSRQERRPIPSAGIIP